MGAVNCCVDAAVDEHAYSACEPTSESCAVVQTTKRAISGKECATDFADASSLDASSQEQSTTCVSSHPSVASSALERLSESAVTEHQQRRERDKRARSTRRTQSLPYAPLECTLWLSDYLCPCDPCPHSLCADRLLDAFYCGQSHAPANTHERHLLHRVLRACGTFDERNALDLELVQRVHRLAAALNGDEDKVFRAIVARNKLAPAPALPLPEQRPVVRSTRLSTAVTA